MTDYETVKDALHYYGDTFKNDLELRDDALAALDRLQGDARAALAVEAFTAPDADWDTMLDSLRARIADGQAENTRLRAALERFLGLEGNSVEAEEWDTDWKPAADFARGALGNPSKEET